MKNSFSKICFLASAAVLTCSCGALNQSAYEPPKLTLTSSWANASSFSGAESSPWWTRFKDDNLNRLIAMALAENNDLAVAALKVKEARLKANLAVDEQYLPDMSGTGTASKGYSLRKKGDITRTFGVALSASYEIDLWGKLASQKDSAAWEAAATEQDKESAVLALVGTVTDLYWKIGYLNERIALSEASIDYRRKAFELARVQHSEGAFSAIDLAEAERALASQEAAHTQYMQQLVEAMNAFSILFNAPPEALKITPPVLPKDALPSLPADVPASLLERRPDLRAAEFRLRKSLADVDATRASYLPTFSLTGSLGSSSVSLSKVLTDPIGTLGAGIALPFLNWFDMRNNIDISETQYEEAVVTFRQAVYNAFADVENALSARAKDSEQGVKLLQASESAQKAEELFAVQYKEGYISLVTLLEAQEKSRDAQAAVLDNRYAQLSDCAALYKALGGDAIERPSHSAESGAADVKKDQTD